MIFRLATRSLLLGHLTRFRAEGATFVSLLAGKLPVKGDCVWGSSQSRPGKLAIGLLASGTVIGLAMWQPVRLSGAHKAGIDWTHAQVAAPAAAGDMGTSASTQRMRFRLLRHS